MKKQLKIPTWEELNSQAYQAKVIAESKTGPHCLDPLMCGLPDPWEPLLTIFCLGCDPENGRIFQGELQ